MNKKFMASLASLLLVSGCALNASVTGGGLDSKGLAEDHGDLQSFYTQNLDWKPCGSHECATIKVPLDYENPKGKTISLALLKVPASSGKPMGTLFINPGGPGGSGIEMAENATLQFSSKLTKNYDIVGFDPRGVGKSTAVDCLDDAELGKILDSGSDMSTEAGREAEKQTAENIVKACEKKSGELLPYVGTESAARDLDVMRALVGESKLNYLGYSYGTELGGQYAELFPKHVGKMVLDGAVNTQLSSAKISYDQTLGFELAYQHYLQFCIDKGNCPMGSTVAEGQAKTRELLDKLRATPLPTGNENRPLTEAMMTRVIIGLMYSNENWSYLTQALTEVVQLGEGKLALSLADLLNDREGDTFKNNSTEANWAINCADFPPSSAQEYADYTALLKKEAPVFGAMQTEGTDLCSLWPSQAQAKKNLGPFVAKGSAPIVVIGTRYDPATPHQWAVDLRKSLENSVLVTWNGDGHVAYGRGSKCIEKAVDSYFVDGVVPQDGLECN